MAEFLTTNMGVNETGNLTVSGVDMVALAKEYGTPLYVMDETMIRTVCRKFRDSFPVITRETDCVLRQQSIFLQRNIPHHEIRRYRY